MACGGLMSAPVCLIENDENGKLRVRKEAKDILDGISEPVVVVSVVGLYRTGKSYLMNRLAGQQTGFALGCTIESKTKGIWMWCVPHPNKKGHTLVLLDTEGLGDVKKGDEKHDTWIFCLAVLLSSTLVYNSLGVIDNMALEKLQYPSYTINNKLTENIRVKAEVGQHEDESADFIRFFPSFVWAVRDFSLKLEKEDKPITSDEYLEGSLELKQGSSPQAAQYNLPRSCLRNFFAVRKCFVFPRPANTEGLQKMEELTEEELDSKFLEQANTFCRYIYNNSEPKTVSGGRTITGTALGNLAEVYVEAIRSGKVPCLENAVVSLAKIQNVRAVAEALQFYMTELFKLVQLPINPAELSNIHTVAEKNAIDVFITMSFSDNDQIYQKELMGKIHEEYQQMCQHNYEASSMQCEEVLRDVFDRLEKGISDGSYLKPGGSQKYIDMLRQLSEEYRARTHSQIMSEEVLSRFLKTKEETGNMILQADESLSAAEQEKEAEKMKTEILKQQKRSLKEQNRLQEQMYQDMQRTCDEHMNQIIYQMEREQDRMRRDNERVLEAKLRESKALLKMGFQWEAARMQSEINSLKAEMEKEKSSQPSKLGQALNRIGMATTLLAPGFPLKLIGVVMACGGLMSAPVCLIENDEEGKLRVRKEAKDILDGISEPVVVVSVMGLYRTGKSYLMNRLAGQQSGFALGNTTESETKGIWMWCVPHPYKEGHTLVLLDTEGLGDVKKGDEKHDTWIFCLAVLLSSTLVYNSLGVIDNTALEKLHAECSYVTELTENIRVKAEVSRDEDKSADFMRVFPSFVWAVRDFTLELKIGNKQITSDEYLGSALTLKSGCSPQTEQYNLPRRCLRHFFAVRKCFVFPPPANWQNMKRIEKLTEKELDSEFLLQAETFRKYIFENAAPKIVGGGHTVTGTALGNLAEVYVKMIRSGKVLCLENAVVSLAKIQNVRAVEEALQFYMTEMFSMVQLPMRSEELSNIHQTAEKKAIKDFITKSLSDNDQIYQQELMSERVLSKFLKGKEEAGSMILQADQSLSTAEQEKEVEKLKKELLEQQQRSLHEQNFLQMQMFTAMQKSCDEHVNQIIHLMERQQERMRRDNEQFLEAKLRERCALLEQGFQCEAARMKSEIDSLKADMDKEKSSQPSKCTAVTELMLALAIKLIGFGISRLSDFVLR
ncbi:guanylate-binding 1-like protein [Labeo rohita]|uniref:Guanylate-binding 1-like protein n=1 Tax=Labeo rohita TaxID=84645 RepID=A0A498NS90_LABRO|nr:guanylate-binding 1-like protein [Labeo rohita]